MGGEAGDRGGGAMEAAGTRGNRQQDGCERNKRSFLCNGKWWRPAFFIVLSLSLHPHQSHTHPVHTPTSLVETTLTYFLLYFSFCRL